jgi:hypothetical protein
MNNTLPFGIPLDDFLAFASATAAFLVLLAIWQGLVVRDPLAARVRALANRRDALRAGLRANRGRQIGEEDRIQHGFGLIGCGGMAGPADRAA